MTDRFNPACGCVENINPCNTVFKRVDELPSLGDATRNHGYVLPDNTVWVVNSDGTGFTQLNGGNGTPVEAPTVEIDQDTKHWVINGQDTGVVAEGKDGEDGSDGQDGQDATAQPYDDTAVKQRLTALENKVDNDTVYDDTNVKNRLTALEAKVDNDTTYTAGTNIKISDNNVISATDKFFGNVSRATTQPHGSGAYFMTTASDPDHFLPTTTLGDTYIVVNLYYDTQREMYMAFNLINGDTYSKVKDSRNSTGELDWKKLN